jgi:hypothetical protein
MRALALIVFLTGCGVPSPDNPEVVPPAGAELAEAIVVAEWSARLDFDVGELPPVRWFSGDCLDYGEDTGWCEVGRTWVPSLGGDAAEIQLARRPTFHQTALAHEALHWALFERDGDPDADHSGQEWGVSVNLVEYALDDAGL